MDKRKPCEFEIALDKTLSDLGLDLTGAKSVRATGTSYQFHWNDFPFWISVPVSAPNSYSNVFRVDIDVATLDERDAGRVLYEIAYYLTVNDCTVVRVVPHPIKERKVKIQLEIVGLVDWFQPDFISFAVPHMAELAQHFRETMIEESQDKAA